MSLRFAFFSVTLLLLLTPRQLIGQTDVNSQSGQTGDRPSPAAGSADPHHRLSLFDGKSLEPWTISQFGGQEDIRVEDGALVMEMGYPLVGITYGAEFPTNNYLLTLKAKKLEGTDFFCCVTFPVGDEFCSLVAGGWGGNVTGISSVDTQDASQNQTRTVRKYELDRWYEFKIAVANRRIRCWIDGESIVDLDHSNKKLSLRPEVVASKPLGICSFETRAAIKDIFLEPIKQK